VDTDQKTAEATGCDVEFTKDQCAMMIDFNGKYFIRLVGKTWHKTNETVLKGKLWGEEAFTKPSWTKNTASASFDLWRRWAQKKGKQKKWKKGFIGYTAKEKRTKATDEVFVEVKEVKK
jgi:hypothetical protein